MAIMQRIRAKLEGRDFGAQQSLGVSEQVKSMSFSLIPRNISDTNGYVGCKDNRASNVCRESKCIV